MIIVRRILRNLAFVSTSAVGNQFFAFVTTVYLARILSPFAFGELNFAFTIVSYFALFTFPGVPILGVREVAKSKTDSDLRENISNIFILRVIFSIFSFIFLLLFTLFFKRSLEMKYLIIFYGLMMFITNISISWVFQGIERMEYSELPGLLYTFLYMNLILLFIRNSNQLLLIPYLAFLLNIFTFIFSLVILFKFFKKIKLSFQPRLFKKFFIASLPLSVFPFLVQGIHNIDKLFIGFMKNPEEFGYYSCAIRFITVLLLAIMPYYSAIFPALTRSYYHAFESFRKLNLVTARIMFTISIPIALGGFALARPLITLIFGSKYAPAVSSLQILILSIMFVYINSLFSQCLIAIERQNKVLQIISIQLIFMVIFGFIFIPQFGLKAAAASVLFGEVLAFFIYYREHHKLIKIPLGSFILKPLLSSLVMLAFLKIYAERNIILLIFVGVTIYLFSLVLFRGFPWGEAAIVWRAITKSNNNKNS